MRYGIADNDTECKHASESAVMYTVSFTVGTTSVRSLQCPLSHLNMMSVGFFNVVEAPITYGNHDETSFAITMLHGSLKRVGSAEFRINDNETNGPVHLVVRSITIINIVGIEDSTVIVKATRSAVPMAKPACRKAYGWPSKFGEQVARH